MKKKNMIIILYFLVWIHIRPFLDIHTNSRYIFLAYADSMLSLTEASRYR